MLITFRTKAYADITMFGDVAVKLLKLMGHSGTVPSALLAQDVPEALERLRRAVDAQPASAGEAAGGAGGERRDEAGEPVVSLKNRAYPLIQLLDAAARENEDVTWDG